MIRKVGLVGLVMCLLGILSAAPASAEFHSSVEHTVLDGKQVGTDSLVFNAGKITCSSITYSGTQTTKTSTTASLTPAYSGCNAFGFIGVTIDVNGCQLVLHTSTGLTDISCGEKPITVTAPNCTLTIGSQTGLASSTFATEGATPKRDVKAKLSLAGLKYTQVGSGGTPCTSNSFGDGSYAAEATLTGTDTSESQIDLWFEKQPRFHSSVEHTTFDGAQPLETEGVFSFQFQPIYCTGATYTGTQAVKTSTKLSLTPAYKGCKWAGGAAVFNVNNCQFVLQEGTVEIECPGAPMEIVIKNVCTITLGSQTVTGISYTTEGATPKRDITIKFDLTGLKHTQAGFFCSAGTFSSGTYKDQATVTGTDTAGSQADFWYA